MKKLWIIFRLIVALSFGTLLWIGTEIFREAPPIPTQVVTTDGTVLIDEGEISNGQNVWQALGGMQVGSIWGHGSYVAPDWTADYLHREATYILENFSKDQFGKDYASLKSKEKASVRQEMEDLMQFLR